MITNKQTVFLVVHQGFSARYLLRSDFFSVLRDSDVRIVILAPNSVEEYFQKEFAGENTFVENYDFEKYDYRFNRLHAFFALARLYSHNNKYFVNFPRYWYGHYRRKRNNRSFFRKVYNLALDLLVYLLCNFRIARKMLPVVEGWFTPTVHSRLFKKYRPDALITTSLGVLPYDRFIMHEGKRNGAKVLSFVLSWDNTTTKGVAGARVDHVVAWTETMRQELIDLHDFVPEQVFVGGVAQYDEYFKDEMLYPKEQLFKKFGLDPKKKLIFYGLESPTQYPWNLKLLELMTRLMATGSFVEPCQVVARLHPIYFRIKDGKLRFQKEIDELKQLQDRQHNLHFDYPEILSQKMSFDMPKTEVYKLGSLLKNADIVLCFYSSLMIEASIFDTPVINIALYHKNDLPNEVMGNHNHNKRVLATGGVKTVFDENSLVSAINDYLTNPALDRDGRRNIVGNETGPHRGYAGKAIGRHFVKLLECWD